MSNIAVAETCLDCFVRYFSADQACGGEIREGISPATPQFPRKMQRTHLQQAAAHFGHHYTLTDISNALQAYRSCQGRDGQDLRYSIAARGYARASWWFILDGPGFNRTVSEEMLLAHTKWVPQDAASRAIRDVVSELIPAMEPADTQVNMIVGVCQTSLATMLEMMVEQITTQVTVGASSLSLSVEDIGLVTLTAEEELALDSLLA